MTLDDLRRLNFRDVGNWPLLPKVLALVAVFLAILIAGALLDWKDQYDALERVKSEEAKLKEQYAVEERPRRSTSSCTSSSCRKSSSRSARS